MRTFRYVGKCSAGHFVNVAEIAIVNANGGWIPCPCGRKAFARSMEIKVSAKECAELCMAATGPSCSCSCGGENHGRNHAA